MKKFLYLPILLFFAGSSLFAQANFQVESFSPQGTSKNPRQVSVRFSEDMVALGDPREVGSVFRTNCQELGKSRWLDPKNWVFDFHSNLPGGMECTFTMNPSLRSLANGKPTGQKEFSFSTGGVNVSYSYPWNGGTISEDQYFLLRLDGNVDAKSLSQNIYFVVDDSPGKIYANIIKGKAKEEAIQAAYWTYIPEESVVVIAPKTEFSPESKVRLVWSKGIASQSGVRGDKDQVFNYKVQSRFQASFYCERENAQKKCIPFSNMELRFSSSLDKKYTNDIYMEDSKGKKWNAELVSGDENTNLINSLQFRGPFPEKTKFKIHIPKNTKDSAGRILSNSSSFPLSVETDYYPPLAKFSAKFGILEKKASPILPVTIRNLDSQITGKLLKIKPNEMKPEVIGKWMKSVYSHKRTASIFQGESDSVLPLQVPKTQQDGSMEVVGIPLIKPGFYVVELESKILGESLVGKNQKLFVPTIALVTDLSIHFKWGRESALVWVTELSTGKPVEGANVVISDCKGRSYARGRTDSDGIVKVNNLPDKSKIPYCSYNTYENGLYVMAHKGEDTSFLHSSWNHGIETWRYNLPYANFREEQIFHTLLDRTLFRAGETVNMKHIVRKHSMNGFVSPDLKSIPSYIMTKHEGTEEIRYQKLSWSYPGKAVSEWKIPKSATLGNYSIYLANSDKDSWGLEKLGGFRVEEFRLPILQASVSSSKSTWVDQNRIPLTLQAKYLAGGTASGLPVKLRTKISPSQFKPKGWEKFSFSSVPLKTGRVSSRTDSTQEKGYTTTELKLNKEGMASHTVSWDERNEVSGLFAEMEFRDPNGEIQSVSNRVQLLPANQFVGIATDTYSMNQEKIDIQTVVVDFNGKPKPNAYVEVNAYKQENYTHRKRLVGGFYSYEYYSEIKSLGNLCSGKTDKNGFFVCKARDFKHSGDMVFEAKSKDDQGKLSYANRDVWVSGKDDWWYSANDHDRMDILLDKQHYKVGEKARVQIQAPFSRYTALITVEREGILKSYIQEIDGKKPYFDLPIDEKFAPNVFINVMAVRGRVGDPKETAMVDLARPSIKMGISEIKVGWDPYRLNVDVKTDKNQYKIRTKAKINFKVTKNDGSPARVGGEIAVAIVDEALLELSGNNTTDLLATMMGTRGIEVESYTGQLQVVGKRHFGRKAVPSGGGGGNQPTRELLDSLLYWNPSIQLNKNGQADILVPVKDALTSYRIIAVANSGVDSFGTGEAKFTATQDILLFSGVPPVVRTGDRYFHEYNLKNNTNTKKSLRLSLIAGGTNGPEKFQDQTVSLEPGESKRIGWDTLIGDKEGGRDSKIQVIADSKVIDSLKVEQKIEPAIPQRVTQGTLFQLDGNSTIPISLPKDGLQDKGRVDFSMSSTILSSVHGIQDYMRDYPYTCMEQKVSKAVVSESSTERESVANELGSHQDEDGLIKFFPKSQWGDEILTAYILSIADEAGWKLPSQNVDSMTQALNRFLDGTLIRRYQYNFSDTITRRLQIMEALSRYGKLDFNRLNSLDVDVKLLPTSSVLDLISMLKRSKSNNSRNKLLKEAETNLRSRLDIQGREMKIADDHGDLWWLMGSQDQDSARLVSYALDTSSYQPDLGRLAIGFTSRMKDGRFRTTLANSYGFLALKKFARTQEKDQLTGITNVDLSGMKRIVSWSGKSDESFQYQLPMNQDSKGELVFEHKGSGKPWVSVSTVAAVPLKKDWFNGIQIRKTIHPVEQKNSGKWTVGDIIQVKIEWDLSAPRTWVVINDPIPSGSTILGSGLGRDRKDIGTGSIQNSYSWASFQERSFSGYKSYYDYLPQGKYSLEYSFRLNQEGKFTLPPTRGEAMYSPDIFGETPNQEWVVLPD